ncbi:hypothetical protein [Frigoriglobus tundricola]|uniref:Uncharacterized protein n=1 Tax=Frigoriglobus tundricola TaxID=2774151 RepID=A0A6M5YVE8_9BACT|nr:hypothetical protein [Frigoriglobus tundricola]QJW97919.1 hypothetical protein FTUN_5499 [Frigoriglobus tundricola]
MAYNPFNIFRRNQKALFAVLTVFIMVMFTLQSGVAGGDFFETFSRWLGAKAGSKEAVCTIDGHKVTIGELDGGPRSLQFRRVMANRFMFYAARQTVNELLQHANSQRSSLSDAGRRMADAAQRAFQAMFQLGSPEFQRFVQSHPLGQQLAQEQVQSMVLGQQMVDSAIDSPNFKEADKDVARAYRTAFALRRYLQDGQGEQYFVNAPNRTRRDLVDFKLWEKKADQLGIHYTRTDVKKLIQTDFFNFFKSDVEVRKQLQNTPGFTMENCLDALAAEFRVRTAQTAVLGQPGRYHSAAASVIPFEMYEYYSDQTSPATYELISVPALGFVDKVNKEPTDAEVNELFKKYENAEPNPRSETPGFKEPRKIAVAWLGARGDEPYYKALATEQLKIGEVMAKASGALTVPLPGGVATWTAGAVAPLGLKEPAVDAAYAKYADEFRSEMQFKYGFSSVTTRDLLPSSTVKAGAIAAMVGGFVGQPLAGVAGSIGAPIAYEIRDRAKVGLPLVIGAIPGPGLLSTSLAGLAAARISEPKPLSIGAMRPELMKLAIDNRAKVLAFGEKGGRDPGPDGTREKGDFARFSEELAKLTEGGKPKDPAAVDKYIKDFIATRGIPMSGASTAARDEWTLEDDPGLLPLVLAQKESLERSKGAHGLGGDYIPFGRSFFWTSDFDRTTFRPVRGPATSGNYQPQPYPPNDPSSREGQLHFLVWRTEDIQPKKTNLITARVAVVAAWKRLQARELALARANAIADAIRTSPSSDPLLFEPVLNQQLFDLKLAIRNPKADERARKFTMRNVAPLTPSLLGQLQPFSLSESNDIPYPTLEMATALVDNRDKPAKTVLVLPDAPKDTFYVATLMSREPKRPSDFTTDVYGQRGSARPIVEMYREETVKKYRESVLTLMKKEFKYEETEEQKKKLDDNTKSGGRGSDD